MDYAKLIEHPDKDKIISKLLEGVLPKDVQNWLKGKYPDKKNLVLPINMMDEFIKSNFTNYQDQFNKDLAILKNESRMEMELKVSSSLLNNKTYQERMIEYADKKIDIEKTYESMIHMAMDRAIQVFDKIQENPSSAKPDYVLVKWFETIFNGLEKFDKHKNSAPEQIINNNYTIQYFDKTNAFYQEIIREILADLDPDTSLRLMDKINAKFRSLQSPDEKQINIDEQLSEVKLLAETIKG